MQKRLRIGVLYSRVRVEEKWIFGAMEKRGIDYERLDDRVISFDLDHPAPWLEFDAVLERSISYTSGLYALRILNAFGIPTVNTAAVAEACGDKVTTSAILAEAGLPQPRNMVAFTPESALAAIEKFGYPVVLKPAVVRGDVCWQKSTTATPPRPCWNTKPRLARCSIRSFTSRNLSRNQPGVTSALSSWEIVF